MRDINRYLLSLIISGFLMFLVFFIGNQEPLSAQEEIKPQLQQVAIQLNTVQINRPKKLEQQKQKPTPEKKIVKKDFSKNITQKKSIIKEEKIEPAPIKESLKEIKREIERAIEQDIEQDITLVEKEPLLKESLVSEENTQELAVSTETQGAILNSFALHYPRKALERGIEGRVLVNIFLTELGDIVSVELLESSGYDILDISAVEQSYNAVISPAINSRGELVSSNLVVDIRFNLTDDLPIID